jgi:hypothetical protein
MILFSGTDTHTAKAAKLKMLLAEIDSYDDRYILNADVEKTVEYLRQKYGFEIPVLEFDKQEIVDVGESKLLAWARPSLN